MQIQAIQSISFRNNAQTNEAAKKSEAPANEESDKKDAESKSAAKPSPLGQVYINISKKVAYDARRMSEGREQKDGELKSIQTGVLYTTYGILAASFLKLRKSKKLNKLSEKLIKENAPEEKIKELQAIATKKLKTSKNLLIASIAGLAAFCGVMAYNIYDAKQTAKERGFMTDDEIKLKELTEKVNK